MVSYIDAVKVSRVIVEMSKLLQPWKSDIAINERTEKNQ